MQSHQSIPVLQKEMNDEWPIKEAVCNLNFPIMGLSPRLPGIEGISALRMDPVQGHLL